MSLSLSEIEEVKNVLVYQCISVAGTVNSPVYFNMNNIQFQPDFAIIRSLIVTAGTANANQYCLYSNLGDQLIASFGGASANGTLANGGTFTSNPNTLVSVKNGIQQIFFEVRQVDNTTTPGLKSPTLAGTWYLSVSIDFIRLRKYPLHNKSITN